jgi:hypothetical protein
MTTDANPGSGFGLKIRDIENERNVLLSTNPNLKISAPQNFVTPGTIITSEAGFMRFVYF